MIENLYMSALVIGEGSYGCVHKPQLECKNTRKEKHTNKHISKLMLTKEADEELSQYINISKIDKKKKYYLGKPYKCKPKTTKFNIDSIKKCDFYKDNKFSKTKKKMKKILEDNYSLIILSDGGLDISNFGKLLKKNSDFLKRKKLDIFWKNAMNLLKGILLFQKHGFLHHDVKPHNVVLNTKNKKIRFIDFGFMKKIDNIKNLCKNNKNYFAEYSWWSFPFELPYLNLEKYMEIAEMNYNDKQTYFENLIKQMDDSSSKFSISCNIFFNYIMINRSDKDKEEMINKYFSDLKNFIIHEINKDNYDIFLKKSIETIDLFGVGITLQYILCHSMDYFNSSKFTALENCFFNMMRPSVMYRYTIEQSIDEFDKIINHNNYSDSYTDITKNKEINKNKTEKIILEQDKLMQTFNSFFGTT